MKELKASNRNGQAIIERASTYEGFSLRDVYDSYSARKEKAYEWCMEQCGKTTGAYGFHICSHNTFGFTCAWFGEKDNEQILRYETKDNSYLVWLER